MSSENMCTFDTQDYGCVYLHQHPGENTTSCEPAKRSLTSILNQPTLALFALVLALAIITRLGVCFMVLRKHKLRFALAMTALTLAAFFLVRCCFATNRKTSSKPCLLCPICYAGTILDNDFCTVYCV